MLKCIVNIEQVPRRWLLWFTGSLRCKLVSSELAQRSLDQRKINQMKIFSTLSFDDRYTNPMDSAHYYPSQVIHSF